MKVKLNRTCSCGEADEIVDVEQFEDARRMVITGVASEIPGETLAPPPEAAPKTKKAPAKKT